MAYSASCKAAIGALRACYEREGLADSHVRRAHGDHGIPFDAPLVLVACSGGRDSLALAWAAQRVGAMVGVRVGAVIVDHQLQSDSAVVAAQAAQRCEDLGCSPVVVVPIDIPDSARRAIGTEAAAREGRYQALSEQAQSLGAAAVLLAHTRDDQAETVVLGLLHGSSPHALAAMAERTMIGGVAFCRPFLGLSRANTTDICRTNNLQWWDDPTNGDDLACNASASSAANGDSRRDFSHLPLRSQVRQALMPAIAQLGGAAAASRIARIGEALRADDDYCTQQAEEAYRRVRIAAPTSHDTLAPHADAGETGTCVIALDRQQVCALPSAIRRRVLRRAIDEELAQSGDNRARPQLERQVQQLDSLVNSPRGGWKIAVSADVYIRRRANVIELCLNKHMQVADIQNDIDHVLLTHDQIESKLAEVAKQIDHDYADKNLLIVAVLKGAVNTVVGLTEKMSIHAPMDFISVSSYGSGTTSSGVIDLRADLTEDVRGKDILIVEDIIDSGFTLNWLINRLHDQGAASVEVFPLLNKSSRREYPIQIKYKGYDIPDEFVVGFGLDYDQNYRNLDSIAVLKPSVYQGE